MNGKVLVVAAHPDDEVLGCGGTTAWLEKQGCEVEYLILGGGRGDDLDNQFDKEPLLYWIELAESALKEYEPQIIFTHYENDLNIDHQITYRAVITACRPVRIRGRNIVREIYSFEVLSNTEWSLNEFQPDTYCDIGPVLHKKIQKMSELYPEEMRRWPFPRSVMGMRYLALYRGMQAGCEYAEAFKTMRRTL